MHESATRLAAGSLRVLPRKHISRALGRLSDLKGPKPVLDEAIRAFVRAYRVDMSDAVVPSGGFSSFDDFFTRRLVDGARPIDPDRDVLVSPSDGRLDDFGEIRPGATFSVKHQTYTVAGLLGDTTIGNAFDGGAFAVVYLAPPDYHRVHAPVNGRVTSMRHIDGTLYPVNSIGIKHVPRLFAQNERVAVTQASERHGEVVTILVGAIGVGRIGLAFENLRTNTGPPGGGFKSYGAHGPSLDRGAELGAFHLGSTVVLLLGPSPRIEWLKAPGDRVRMGEALARRIA